MRNKNPTDARKKTASEEKNVVKSVAKAFSVLQAFGPDSTELVIAEVARSAALDNATAFRMLNTLVSLGFVERVPDTRRFRLTLKCLDLGFNAIARSDLRNLARPLMRAIVGRGIEATSIGVLDGPEIVYIERVQAGLERLAVDVRIGYRVPTHSSALGRAILSQLPEQTQRAILSIEPPKRLTERTVISIEKILGEIAQARKLGYAISEQETVIGLRVIAAPITDADGVPVAAISAVSSTFGRTLEQFIAEARGPICDASAHLSHAIRGAGGFAMQQPAPHGDALSPDPRQQARSGRSRKSRPGMG